MIPGWVFGLIVTWFGVSTGTNVPETDLVVHCGGALGQGGLIVCGAPSGAELTYGGTSHIVGADGLAVFGLARSASSPATITGALGGETVEIVLDITSRTDPLRVIEGLDCDKVDARTPEQKAHAGESWVIKQTAFSEFHDGNAWAEGFARPAAGRSSSPFGPQRQYIGVSAVTGEPCESFSVHRGYDIAAPVGTPLLAPAAGTIILADPDLYYEGGTIFLDHGHGLVSVMIHLSSVDVAVGDRVEQGDVLGETGNTGRTTGPHLHWAVKWRDTSSEDRSGDFYIDPALLLQADFSHLVRAQSSGPLTVMPIDGPTP